MGPRSGKRSSRSNSVFAPDICKLHRVRSPLRVGCDVQRLLFAAYFRLEGLASPSTSHTTPCHATPHRTATQRTTTRRTALHRTAPQRNATQRNATQRNTPHHAIARHASPRLISPHHTAPSASRQFALDVNPKQPDSAGLAFRAPGYQAGAFG